MAVHMLLRDDIVKRLKGGGVKFETGRAGVQCGEPISSGPFRTHG
jgi:hypothetical protein